MDIGTDATIQQGEQPAGYQPPETALTWRAYSGYYGPGDSKWTGVGAFVHGRLCAYYRPSRVNPGMWEVLSYSGEYQHPGIYMDEPSARQATTAMAVRSYYREMTQAVTATLPPLAPDQIPSPDPRTVHGLLREVVQERVRQDAKWGGPRHDDSHSTVTWASIIDRLSKEGMAGDWTTWRRSMVQIAAVALAALESQDRVYRTGRRDGTG